MLKTIRFLSLLLVAISLGAGLAHLFALANKMHLPGAEYLVVQQIYRGWALLGIAVIGTLLMTLILTIEIDVDDFGLVVCYPGFWQMESAAIMTRSGTTVHDCSGPNAGSSGSDPLHHSGKVVRGAYAIGR